MSYLNHWIVALSIDLARDWTWEGFATPAMTVSRDGAVIGTFTFPTAVGGSALGDLTHPADRSTTRLVFLDAISPDPAPGAFPAVLKPVYSVKAHFPEAPAITHAYTTLHSADHYAARRRRRRSRRPALSRAPT